MAISTKSAFLGFVAVVVFSVFTGAANAQLSPNFYSTSCPNLGTIVRSGMASAVQTEKRMGVSILRLFFHDCFVNGCDGSILLDDTSTFTGEKNAGPNANSARGFEVIDAIKTRVEASCKAGHRVLRRHPRARRPRWSQPAWRSDVERAAGPQGLAHGEPERGQREPAGARVQPRHAHLRVRQQEPLAAGHDGAVRCATFRSRIYTERNINGTFAALRQRTCPRTGGDGALAPFDVRTADGFDNAYYQNLVARRGLLHSDQELFNGGSQDAVVRQYSTSPPQFSADFVSAMLKMGGLLPSSGTRTEVRLNCRKPN